MPHRSAPVGLSLMAPGRGPPRSFPAGPRSITGAIRRLSPTTPTSPVSRALTCYNAHTMDWRGRPWTVPTTCATWYPVRDRGSGPGPLPVRRSGIAGCSAVSHSRPAPSHVSRTPLKRRVAGNRSDQVDDLAGRISQAGTARRAACCATPGGRPCWTSPARPPGIRPRRTAGRTAARRRPRSRPREAGGQPAAQLGVGGIDGLEAPVDGGAVDAVGAHPSAHRVARLQHLHGRPGRRRVPRAHRPGHTVFRRPRPPCSPLLALLGAATAARVTHGRTPHPRAAQRAKLDTASSSRRK